MQFINFSIKLRLIAVATSLVTSGALASLLSLTVPAQRSDAPVIVQPGAPGQPSKVLPASTRAQLPPRSKKDVEFMQGMIHHHAQAVEMVELIAERTANMQIRLLGARISQSQQDEMNFMKRWLEVRSEALEGGTPHSLHDARKPPEGGTPHALHDARKPPEGGTPYALHDAKKPPEGGTPHAKSDEHLMPGMLTKAQMDALRNSRSAEFDRLFLLGMIQHHNGALIMVKDLFNTAGAGQDAELFTFASDVDSGQRAEIRSMQNILTNIP